MIVGRRRSNNNPSNTDPNKTSTFAFTFICTFKGLRKAHRFTFKFTSESMSYTSTELSKSHANALASSTSMQRIYLRFRTPKYLQPPPPHSLRTESPQLEIKLLRILVGVRVLDSQTTDSRPRLPCWMVCNAPYTRHRRSAWYVIWILGDIQLQLEFRVPSTRSTSSAETKLVRSFEIPFSNID